MSNLLPASEILLGYTSYRNRACYHLEQNLLSSNLLSKNTSINIKMYRTIILLLLYMVVKLGS